MHGVRLPRIGVLAGHRQHFRRSRPRARDGSSRCCHHDHTSSHVNGRYGASSRSITDSAIRIAVDAEAAASGPKSP